MKENWKYLNEYRRYSDKTHQIYYEGKWVTVKFSRDEEERRKKSI